MDALKLLGGLMGNNATNSGIGGQLMGALMSGGRGSDAQSTGAGVGGGLASAAGNMLSGAGGGAGGLASLLGGAGGGAGGGLLGGLAAAALSQFAGGQGGGAGQMLQQMLGGGAAQPAQDPVAGMNRQQVDDQATVLIRAMCNAAKADGQIDEQEQKNILQRMGDVGEQEIAFLKQELAQPLDVQGFIASVPQDLAQQTYAMSLFAIKLDTQAEAQYLGQLAQGLNLDTQVCNQIHEQLGAPQIFS